MFVIDFMGIFVLNVTNSGHVFVFMQCIIREPFLMELNSIRAVTEERPSSSSSGKVISFVI